MAIVFQAAVLIVDDCRFYTTIHLLIILSTETIGKIDDRVTAQAQENNE